MRNILLTQGKFALVDDEDYEYLNQWKWSAAKDHGAFYAVRSITNNSPGQPRQRSVRMHRLILDAKRGQIVDHKDRNGLNNQRENLRFCTTTENSWNQSKQKRGRATLKGAFFCSERKGHKWRTAIKLNGRAITSSYFSSEEEAHIAYCFLAIEYFGEFARGE